MRRIARLLALPIVLVSSFLSLPAVAQDASGGDGRSTSSAFPANLDDALERVAWDAARQGPLLVVDPKHTLRAATAPPVPSDGYRLRDVASRFGRKVVPLSSLTVLTPSEMVVLNTRPGKPNPLAGLDRAEIAHYLMALLSPSQWQKLGSQGGLGLADLSREQQIAFDALIPNSLVVRKGVAGKWGGVRFVEGGETRLSRGARTGVRLRIMRAVSLRLQSARDKSFTEVNSRNNRPEGAELTTVQTPAWNPGEERPDAQGVALKATVPSRPKPSDLPFEAPALSVPVPLAGAKTVGDLVKRVGEAAGIEIYADARVGMLPLWTRGQGGTTARGARAGDIVQALCQAITGTVRKIRPAGGHSTYVLVDDPVGIGTRCALLADWKSDAEHQKGVVEEQIRTRIAAQPKQFLPFMENDPLTLPAETLQKVEERFAHPGFTREGDPILHEIPLTGLPPAAQALVRTALERRAELARLTGRDEAVREDRLIPDVEMRFFFLLPGLGQIEDINMRLGSVTPRLISSEPPPRLPPVAPVVLPQSMRTRALLIAPRTADEAARAVQATRERGLSQLWFEVPRTGDREILAAAIKAGKEQNLPVLALVRLLSLPPAVEGAAPDSDRTALPRDVNILGESCAAYFRRRAAVSSRIRSAPVQDWVRADLPGTAIALKEWVVAVAGTPGLVGMVLTDTAPPLYGNPGDTNYLDGDGSWGLGYTPEMRLAFLRQEGIDPVDLITPSMALYHNDLRLPFFPEGGSGRQRWFAFRNETNVRLLADLFTAIRAARPGLPLLVRDRPEGFPDLFGYGWYAGWNKPRALPRSRLGWSDQPLIRMARAQGQPVLLTSSYREEWFSGPEADRIQEFTRSLADILDAVKGDWDGIVLDLSAMPVNKALPLLQALAPAPTPAAGKR